MILDDTFDAVTVWTYTLTIKAIVLVTAILIYKRKSQPHPKDCLKITGDALKWKPAPLIEEDLYVSEPILVEKIDDDCLNVGATSFLCLEKKAKVSEDAIKALHKYGVGSCGPRGFYGTIDVHLELEERLAKFLNVEETCVYSYGFSTIASAIPSYAKKGDIIFADECVWFAIQKGFEAARSTVYYYKHNDMDNLEQLLQNALNKNELKPKRRAFLVTEAIFYNTGEICPVPEVVKLARKFKLRIILDESLSIGVLGKNGRGITEYQNVPIEEIDLIVGSLEHSFATVGGFCAGSHFIVEHQRLSGLGYCFSASLPPLLTQAAITGLDILESEPSTLKELEACSKGLHKALSNLKHYSLRGADISPVKHLYAKNGNGTEKCLREIAKWARAKGIAFSVACYLPTEQPAVPTPSIRVASSVKMTPDIIDKVASILDEAYEAVCEKMVH